MLKMGGVVGHQMFRKFQLFINGSSVHTFCLSCLFGIWLDLSNNPPSTIRISQDATQNTHVYFLVVLPGLVFLLLLLDLERIVQPISLNLVPGLSVTSISFLCPLKMFIRSQAAQAPLENFASIFTSFIECLS